MKQQQVPFLDTYLKSSYGLGSSNIVFQYIGYSVLCVEQVIATFTPVLYKFITFALLLLMPMRQLNDLDENNSSLSSVYDIGNKVKAPEPIILNQYRNFVDDRKAKVGSITDIQRLRQFGYRPFRYLSPSFVELISASDDSKSDRTGAPIVKEKATNKKNKKTKKKSISTQSKNQDDKKLKDLVQKPKKKSKKRREEE